MANTSRPGYVYEIYSGEGSLLYVGKTVSPLVRLGNHAATQPWSHLIASVVLTPYADEADALAAEAWTIAAKRPHFNRDRPPLTGDRAPVPAGPEVRWEIPTPTEAGVNYAKDEREVLAKARAEEIERLRVSGRGPVEHPRHAIEFFEAYYRIEGGGPRVNGGDVFALYEAHAEALKVSRRERLTRRGLFRTMEALGAERVKSNHGVTFTNLRRI